MQSLPQDNLWTTYEAEADVLYINFQQPPLATDESELTDDDIVSRYKDNQIYFDLSLKTSGYLY